MMRVVWTLLFLGTLILAGYDVSLRRAGQPDGSTPGAGIRTMEGGTGIPPSQPPPTPFKSMEGGTGIPPR